MREKRRQKIISMTGKRVQAAPSYGKTMALIAGGALRQDCRHGGNSVESKTTCRKTPAGRFLYFVPYNLTLRFHGTVRLMITIPE